MNSYRDSYMQYHHLDQSYHVLYSDWLRDELPLVEEQNGGGNVGNVGDGLGDDSAAVRSKPQASLIHDATQSEKYWGVFYDEDDWEIFKYATLESNGVVNFGGAAGGGDGSRNRNANISGSLFNKSKDVMRVAYLNNNSWDDWSLYEKT